MIKAESKEQDRINSIKKASEHLDQKSINPKELEYWRNIFPTKTDKELEVYRVKWSNENPKYLKFKNIK
jgi:hypothetical protein